MIFGHNWGHGAMPEMYRKRFPKYLRDGARSMLLQGIATTAADRDTMLMQANNGHRELKVVEKRDAQGVLYGVYVD